MKQTRQLNIATIEVICGPMFSGKTEELIKRINYIKNMGKNIAVFKPNIDTRYEKSYVTSHNNICIEAISVKNSSEICNFLKLSKMKISAIGIDEAQFFKKSLIKCISKIANSGIKVILSGLDEDFKGQPFGIMPEIMAIANKITKKYGICAICSALANKSYRLKNITKKQILIGAAELYEARCEACFAILETQK